MPRNPEELIELAAKLQKPMELYLKYKQLVGFYERGLKTVYAKCFLRSPGETVKEREMQAYTDPEYLDWLENYNKIEKEMVKAQVNVEAIRTNLDAHQSALAFDREAMRHL